MLFKIDKFQVKKLYVIVQIIAQSNLYRSHVKFKLKIKSMTGVSSNILYKLYIPYLDNNLLTMS